MLKEYFNKNYKLVTKQLESQKLKEEIICSNKSLYQNYDLERFLNKNTLKENSKNLFQSLAKDIYQHLEIKERSSKELCL